MLMILGVSGTVGTVHAPLESLQLDLVALGIVTAGAAVVITTRKRISRAEGMLLMRGCVAFLFPLILGQGN